MNRLVYKNPLIKTVPTARRGFALVVTLSLMILLTVIAVGLLTLSSISLRTASSGSARARAVANAKLGMLMALGQLQRDLGDDRRISADASISDKAGQPNLVGAWESWSPDIGNRPDGSAPKYDPPKADNFLSWLVSAPDPLATAQRDWAESTAAVDAVKLFSMDRDGFEVAAQRVDLPTGAYAWGVSQENTKAKINVAGPETDSQAVNANLQVQPRPSLALSDVFSQPDGNWNQRAARLLSSNQVALDTSLGSNPEKSLAAGASYTTQSQGLLTDAVHGGLKVDLNLGFELNDSQFANDKLGDSANPFREAGAAAKSNFSAPGSYKGEHPLYKPILSNPIVSATTSYEAATLDQRFYAAGVPTFDHLRSFYRIPHHLYGGANPTVKERGGDQGDWLEALDPFQSLGKNRG